MPNPTTAKLRTMAVQRHTRAIVRAMAKPEPERAETIRASEQALIDDLAHLSRIEERDTRSFSLVPLDHTPSRQHVLLDARSIL